jgi:hypothetical protein
MAPQPSQTTGLSVRAAAEAYASARAELQAAHQQADAAWTRLQASPDTLEYQIDWSEARRHEAALAARVAAAEREYVRVGGYARDEPDE